MLQLIKGRQSFPRPRIEDVAARVRAEMARCFPAIPRGAPVAIAVGSRGIARLAEIVRAVATEIRARGGAPFIVPAMGSHGGATPDGQEAVLASYGVTEAGVGAPVRSSMEVVELPRGDAPCRVFMDKLAFEAHGTVLINRVKPHTDYHGKHESGLVKMSVIGLGKHAQALEVHRYGTRGLREYIPQVAAQVLRHGRILAGIGIVENAYHEVALLEAARAEDVPRVDAELLEKARALMPRLPADEVDVLIVDEMGKDVSGTGLDTNIIGRMYIKGDPEPAAPRIGAIVVCDLTAASHGNSIGMGLADVITRRLYQKIDFAAVAENAETSTFLERAKMPVVAPTDALAFAWATRTCRPVDEAELRVLRIRNTLALEDFYASAAMWRAMREGASIVRLAEEAEPAFDQEGNLRPF